MYRKDTLKNGLRVITSSMPGMESVSMGVWIGTGSRCEESGIAGISHVVEHMLFKGTKRRNATALKQAIEGVGGNFNGFTGEELTCYLVKVPAAHTELGLDVLTDMVLYPELDKGELEKEKHVICEEIKLYMDQPAQHIFDVLAELMWPKHPLGRPIIGYKGTVNSFKRENITDYMRRYYNPANISIVACGKIDRQKIAAFAEKTFTAKQAKKAPAYKRVKKIHKAARERLLYKDTEQTRIAFGFHSIPRTHRLKYALSLLNIILGGNMSSRLFERLREEKALCYDIGSSAKKYEETGSFVIAGGVDNSKLLEATGEITLALKDIKDKLVTSDELKRAKEYSRGQFLLGLEDTADRMLWLGEKIMTLGKAPDMKEIFRGIEKVTAEDVRNTANIIFNRKNLNFATIGPARGNVRKKLEGLFKF